MEESKELSQYYCFSSEWWEQPENQGTGICASCTRRDDLGFSVYLHK